MEECFAIINQKGGVGKSTTSNAMGAGLQKQGQRVLYVDLDAQGNLSYSLNSTGRPLTSLEVLTGTAKAEEAVVTTPQGDLIPASPSLASADALLTETGKEYRLKEAIAPLLDSYNYIIIDTPPALGVLTINALTAATSVIIPAQADIYSLQGIGQLYQTIFAVQKYCNKDLKIKGILITRYSSRTILTQDMLQLLQNTAEQLNTKVYESKIRECISIKEAQAKKQDIFSYAPKSNAATDYYKFINQVMI